LGGGFLHLLVTLSPRRELEVGIQRSHITEILQRNDVNPGATPY
jgi:hypothetical protein